MKSGLSASKYIRNNKRTCFVLILALALTFTAMYLVNYLLKVTEESFKTPLLELPKRITYAELTIETMGVHPEDYPDGGLGEAIRDARARTVEQIKNSEGVRDAYYTQVLNANYYAVLGSIGYEFPLVEPEKIPEFLDHMGAKLIEGSLPSGDGEILVDSTILKNNGLTVGGWFMAQHYGKTFKVAGVIESDVMACIGTPNGNYNTGWYIVILTDEAHSDFRTIAEPMGLHVTALDNIEDRPQNEEYYQKENVEVLDRVNRVILLVVMIFLAISVLVAYISFMRNRVGEYCLYASIGFSKREIYGMIMREMGIIFGVGILLGAIFSVIGMAVMDATLVHPQGLHSAWWYPEQVAASLTAYLVIIGLLQIPIMITVHNIKTVDLMED